MGGSGFIRRFTSDPGLPVITAIEGVVIIDNAPPSQIVGVGSGLVTVVGEFEDGPFNTPYQVTSTADFLNTFGGFGFAYNTTTSNYPCACARYADNATAPEYWNGNGFIALAQKRFSQLCIVRVDTSVGSVQFSGVASIVGSPSYTFSLTTGQQLILSNGSTTIATATFTGAKATVTSGIGSYSSGFVGGEQLTFKIDGTQYVATFQSSDQTQAQVIDRLNLAAGYTAFTQGTGTTTVLTGKQGGTGGSVQIVSKLDQSGGAVLTVTGFSLGSSIPGTGNVANISAVTQAEVSTIMTTAAGAGVLSVTRDASLNLRINYIGAKLTGSLVISTCTATGLGFVTGQTASAIPTDAQTIPAGTLVSNGSVLWVTCSTINVTAGNAGPYSVNVRPAIDNTTTGTSANAETVTTTPNPVTGSVFWAVENQLPLMAALTDYQIDSAYTSAIANTENLSNIVSQTNVIVSARQSNAVRVALKSNVIDASDNGCSGRMTVIRPPLGTTTEAMAMSTVAQPGVGTYRNQRVIYAYPGVNVNIPQIAAIGSAGGIGFNDTGNIDVGSDMWLACILSNLNPEENPGQTTTFAGNVLSLEVGNPSIQVLGMTDYMAFKAAGICAPRIVDGNCIFESGVTSVNPVTNFNLRNIARQRMADYIEDSLAETLNVFAKMLPTIQRRSTIMALINSFMIDLLGNTNGLTQRIANFSADGKSQNTTDTISAGVYRIAIAIQTLSSMDDIVLNATIGETVVVQQS